MSSPIRMGDLAPWDQISLCSLPKENFFPNAATGQQLCTADSQRILLAITAPVGAGIVISTVKNPGTPQGIPITSAVGVQIFTADQHGPLTNVAWFLSTGGPVNITVIEIIANVWPDPSRMGNDGQYTGKILIPGVNDNVSPILANNGSSRVGRCDYRWPKSQTVSDNDWTALCRNALDYIRAARNGNDGY